MALAPQFCDVECGFCDATSETVESAIEDGWFPNYFESAGDDEVSEPVCPQCAKTKCRMTDDGLELIDLESVIIAEIA